MCDCLPTCLVAHHSWLVLRCARACCCCCRLLLCGAAGMTPRQMLCVVHGPVCLARWLNCAPSWVTGSCWQVCVYVCVQSGLDVLHGAMQGGACGCFSTRVLVLTPYGNPHMLPLLVALCCQPFVCLHVYVYAAGDMDSSRFYQAERPGNRELYDDVAWYEGRYPSQLAAPGQQQKRGGSRRAALAVTDTGASCEGRTVVTSPACV